MLWASSGSDKFETLSGAITWLFYAAVGAFELDDLEGRDWLLANVVLMLWLALSMLMMLNLL